MKKEIFNFFDISLHEDVLKRLQDNKVVNLFSAGNILSKSFIVYNLYQSLKNKKIIYILQDRNKINLLKSSLNIFNINVDAIYDDIDIQNSTKQIEFITNITKKNFIITSAEFLNSTFISPLSFKQNIISLSKNDVLDLNNFYSQLLNLGYEVSQDKYLSCGQYFFEGGYIYLKPLNLDENLIYKIEMFDNKIDGIYLVDQNDKQIIKNLTNIQVIPFTNKTHNGFLYDYIDNNVLFLDDINIDYPKLFFELTTKAENRCINFTLFPEEEDFLNLRYISVLRFYSLNDFITSISEKIKSKWKIIIYTKNKTEIANILDENYLSHFVVDNFHKFDKGIKFIEQKPDILVPKSFQNTKEKILFLTDRDLFSVKSKKVSVRKKDFMDFISSLKPGGYVVHSDHGVGKFIGIDKKLIGDIVKEYLEIQYHGTDKLFVPIDKADKISMYISGVAEKEPNLTRLDSNEWNNLKHKAKKEAQNIAKDLLQIYAKRKIAKGFRYKPDTNEQKLFEQTFPYEETPGQIQAIQDVKDDMESPIPMDRLVCGDVGFGKTEVAMRAAFKAFCNLKQVVLISPSTILADQHYKSFCKRMTQFNVRIAMLSRFKAQSEQKMIVQKIQKGQIDIVIGTHRLLQKDIQFKDLGLVIIDEEQKFGVKQKEFLKELKSNVDVLTLTATPIPRTLNLSLNKLRDISIINTPPPGRLPIITELRRYSDHIVKDAIIKEIQREGQVYFLHNRVETIEGIASKLRFLLPKTKFVVGHGRLDSKTLENRIIDFKSGNYDVLISSTIIENGIDLSNANTLIVNNADKFGLSQLYQIRGRVGRSKQQAFTYLLYNDKKINKNAKKRLRAIIEATELGSGFDIAMKDLEIRGAGDVLGVSQHGTVKAVGISFFIKLLNEEVEKLKTHKVKDEATILYEDISIDLPFTSYIPDFYVSDYKEKISIYQKLSSVNNLNDLCLYKKEINEEFGRLPTEVQNLFAILEIKILAYNAGILSIRFTNIGKKQGVILKMSKAILPYQIVQCMAKYGSDKCRIVNDALHIIINGAKLIPELRDILDSMIQFKKDFLKNKK